MLIFALFITKLKAFLKDEPPIKDITRLNNYYHLRKLMPGTITEYKKIYLKTRILPKNFRTNF